MMVAVGLSVVSCGPGRPTEEECTELASWLHEIGGKAGIAEHECTSKLNKEEIQCLKSKGWLRITECPGFSKLEIEKDRFTEVYCFSIVTDSYAKHECGYPWVNCERLRRNELGVGTGKQVSSCELVAMPYAIKFSCRDGGACAKYFVNEEECRESLPFQKATENNVSGCVSE